MNWNQIRSSPKSFKDKFLIWQPLLLNCIRCDCLKDNCAIVWKLVSTFRIKNHFFIIFKGSVFTKFFIYFTSTIWNLKKKREEYEETQLINLDLPQNFSGNYFCETVLLLYAISDSNGLNKKADYSAFELFHTVTIDVIVVNSWLVQRTAIWGSVFEG